MGINHWSRPLIDAVPEITAADQRRAEIIEKIAEISDDLNAAKTKLTKLRAHIKDSVIPFEKNSEEIEQKIFNAVTEERTMVAIELRRQNWSYQRIGDLFDRGGTTVKRWIDTRERKIRYSERRARQEAFKAQFAQEGKPENQKEESSHDEPVSQEIPAK